MIVVKQFFKVKNFMKNDSYLKTYIQSNLINMKSFGLDILFRSIESSNYREVDITIYSSHN